MRYINYFFIGILVYSNLSLLFSINPIHKIFFLILIFCCISCLLIIFGMDFFAVLFIIIYVGAIAVLFLFLVMMLDLKSKFLNTDNFIYPFVFIFIQLPGVFFCIKDTSLLLFFEKDVSLSFLSFYVLESFYNINIFAQSLFNNYILCFFIIGIVLLVAMLGTISLTIKYDNFRKTEFVTKLLSRSVLSIVFIS